jgi:hypothetical protein
MFPAVGILAVIAGAAATVNDEPNNPFPGEWRTMISIVKCETASVERGTVKCSAGKLA